MHYLDNSATSRVLPEAARAAMDAMAEGFGNPSSQHRLGIEAARLLKDSREAVASALNAQPNEITFTSGGTESINTAIFGAAFKNRHLGKHIVSTAIEQDVYKRQGFIWMAAALRSMVHTPMFRQRTNASTPRLSLIHI